MSSSLSARDAQLGAGLLVFAIGIGTVEVRMNHTWSRGVLLLVVLVPFLIMLALALRGPKDGDDPTPLTSLLCVLAFAYGTASVYRFGVIVRSHPFAHAGTVTWMLALVTAIASLLGNVRHSATLMLAALVSFSATVLVGADWLFDIHRHVQTYRWIALGLIIIYILGAASIRLWPRLAAVLYVTAGLLLFLMGATMFGLTLSRIVTIPLVLVGVLPQAPWGWELVMLAGGLLLATASAVRRDPGPGWVSAAVFVSFVTLSAAHGRDITIVGWPLALLVAGALVLALAVTDTKNNRFTLAGKPEQLAFGALLLFLGVFVTLERMAFLWSKGVLLAIAVAGLALTAAFAFAQPREGNEPSGPASLLTALTLAYTILVLFRLARFHGDLPISRAGTATWIGGVSALVGVGLASHRRSAGVGLASMALAGGTAIAASIWLLNADAHPPGYAYVLLGLAVLYTILAVLVRGAWPRLATVASVAAGGSLAIGLATIVFESFVYTPTVAGTGAPGAGWLVLGVAAAAATAGAAALLRREAGPGYVAVALGVLAVLLDRRRVLGQSPSLVLWPVLLLGVGAVLIVLSAIFGRRTAAPPAAR